MHVGPGWACFGLPKVESWEWFAFEWTVILFGEFAECAELNGAGDTVKCLLLWIVVNGPLESG